jgi:hypothetical protein
MTNRFDMEPAERLRRTALVLDFLSRPLDARDTRPQIAKLREFDGGAHCCDCCQELNFLDPMVEVLMHRKGPVPYSYRLCPRCLVLMDEDKVQIIRNLGKG